MKSAKYDERFEFMLEDREAKPREKGLTMVIGDGPYNVGGISGISDLMDVSGEWIDWYKIVWSSFPLEPPDLMEEKLRILEKNNVSAFTGGNFLESAIKQEAEDQFFEAIKAAGCPGVEVSSTAIDMELNKKIELVETASEMGLHVHAEIGKKTSETAGDSLSLRESITEMNACLDAGATYVIFEMEEIESSITSSVDTIDPEASEKIESVLNEVGQENILFEIPLGGFYEVMETTNWFIENVGPEVNLGNINPNHVTLLEQQRRNIGPHSL